MKKNLICAGIVLALIAAALFIGRRWGRSIAISAIETKVDTLIIYKTKSEISPLFEQSTAIGYKGLSVPQFVWVTDTLTMTVHDTVYVPITQKYYERLDGRLRLWISGYEPNLDKWELDEQIQYVTKESFIEPKKNKVFLDAGFVYDKSPLLPITVNYGYEKSGLMLYAGGGYDILTKSPVVRVGLRWTPFEF